MIDVLKFFGAPGSITFLAVCLISWSIVAWRFPRARKLAKTAIAAILITYLILSLPVVANLIANSLPAVQTPALNTTDQIRLIVYDGDNRRGRIERTLAILKSQPVADLWYLGDEWFLDKLVQSGVPRDRINTESSQRTTREQVERTAALAASTSAKTVVVVSRLQAARVEALFRLSRIDAVVEASPIDDEPPTDGLRQWVPRYIGLRVSRDAIYELVALRYYRYKGWIGPE